MSVSVGAMTLVELAEFLAASGSYATVADAMAALNIVIVEDVGAAGTALAVTGGPGQLVVGTVGQTALEVAAQGQLAATGSNVTTAGIGLLQGETTTTAAALLGMDVGIVGAACAPLLGVSLGVGLYESNPELWTKISQKLLPFCYPGTTKIPTWGEIVNDIWQVSVAKKVIDALKELFEEEGIGPEGLNYPDYQTSGSVTVTGASVSSIAHEVVAGLNYTGTGGVTITEVGTPGPGVGICFSAPYVTTNAFAGTYTVYGIAEGLLVSLGQRVAYISSAVVRFTHDNSGEHVTITYNNNSGTTPYTIFKGVRQYTNILREISGIGATPGGSYPTGTSEWTGNTPTEIPQTKPAVIGIDSTTGQPITQPMVPISPPVTAPEIAPQPAPEVEPQTIPFPWPEPSTPGHTTPWPTEMPWPLPTEQPDWWPVEIPYPYQYPTQYPSPDPETQSDPTEITDPQTQVQPYVQPLPIPYELPVPEPYPQPDPYLDPTRPRKPTITITPDPPIGSIVDPIPPVGISPWPSMPGTPLAFSQGGGLVTVYHPTPAQLYAFEQWLWVTYADATIDKIFNNPFDGVITLFELYCTPTDVGTQTIKSGFLDSGISSAVISRYTEIDCGTLGIPEYYGNYLDYSPYSKAHVYLPFIGVVELNVDDIVGHAVNITYRIDEYNGSCIAMITVAKVTEVNGEDVEYSNTMYQFSGNCAVELPLAGGSQAAIKAGMMQANAYQNAANISAGASLVGGIGSLLLGSVGGAISGLGQAASNYAYGQANALSNMLSGKSTVQKSGTFGSSHGAMGIKTPFITITRPKQIQVPNYNELYGYPAHKMVYVGDCTGFIRCREVHVVSATANDEEKTMIENLLKTGVYVTE